MSGISIIVSGADFSDSPLGKVTFVKSIEEKAAEVVSSYATAIGDSSFNDELTEMVIALMQLGVWDNMDVFPMLGSTLANKSVNLNPSGFLSQNIATGGNATNQSNYIQFANNLSMGAVTETKKNSYTPTDSHYLYFDLEFVKNELNGSRVYNTQRGLGGSGLYFGTAAGNLFKLGCYQSSVFGTVSTVGGRTQIACDADAANGKLSILDDNGLNQADVSIDPYNVTNLIGGVNGTGTGGSSIESSANNFPGKVYMFAQGDIPQSKMSDVTTILKSFSTGKE